MRRVHDSAARTRSVTIVIVGSGMLFMASDTGDAIASCLRGRRYHTVEQAVFIAGRIRRDAGYAFLTLQRNYVPRAESLEYKIWPRSGIITWAPERRCIVLVCVTIRYLGRPKT